jgi:ABC-type nickel/cobalt efflux system permease component RcnA
VGYIVGSSLFSLESIEAFRADIAGWLLIGFGIIYTVWGIKQAYLSKKHTHLHIHEDGTVHNHEHSHRLDHAHIHKNKTLTPWLIFIIFILGPCEPLIPLLIYPAADHNALAVFAVASVFTIITLLTMQIMVFSGIYGLNFFSFEKIQKHIHALAGISILLCGISIQFLGL